MTEGMVYIVLAAFVVGLLLGAVAVFAGVMKDAPSLTKYIAFSIGVLIAYSVAELVISIVTGLTHDTLTTCVFACFGGEILSCALIKIFKLKEEG